MKTNNTITKAAEIISTALIGAGIAADGWTMQIIAAAPTAADADRYTVAVYQPRHRVPSTVWALTIDTAHDGWTIAARTMECTYNRDTMGAELAPRHALASAITGRIKITAPETETAAETETAERAAENADALDNIRRPARLKAGEREEIMANISINNGRNYCTPTEAIAALGMDEIASWMDPETRETLANEWQGADDDYTGFLAEYLDRAPYDLIIG